MARPDPSLPTLMLAPASGALLRAPRPHRRLGWPDLVVGLALVGLLATVAALGRAMWAPFTPGRPPAVDLSPWRLPGYAARSLLRMFVALGAAFAFTCVVASWAARSRRAARVIQPALDILQSVPVLGFLSATVTFFVALVPGHLLGLELASIFAIFTGQVRARLPPVEARLVGGAVVEQADQRRLRRRLCVSGERRFC